jgi:two-component system cell cycle sensor histidine kinase/response regulator CckA
MKEFEAAAIQFSILDRVPVGLCVIKKDFTVLYWNRCLEGWTGIPRSDILGGSLLGYFPHLDAPKYAGRFQDIFEGGPPTIFSSQLHNYLIPAPTNQGKMRIQHTTVTSVSSHDHSEVYALLAVQDVSDLTHRIQGYREMRDQALDEITERKKAEDALRKAQTELETRVRLRTADLVSVNERLEHEIQVRRETEVELKKLISTLNTLVAHIPEGVVFLDEQQRVVFANERGKDHLRTLTGVGDGAVVENVAGRNLGDFLAYAPRIIWHEVVIHEPSKFVFEVAGRTIRQGDTVSGVVLVLKDVTDERFFEERIHSQERLAAVGQLAAGIAHDFNNILTGIIGFSELMLSDSDLAKEDWDMVQGILQNGQRAAQLIRQILDFSRKSISEMKSLDLLLFLKEFSKFIRRTIPENIHISVDCRPGVYMLWADPTKIQQVLANLVVNARDAMPGGGRLSLSLSRMRVGPDLMPPVPEMSHGDWIVLSVSDTGTGITSEVLTHIFEPFFTTKEVGKGTGLGLSQVYGIIKQHEGCIDVRTRVGRGSAFVIYLPAHDVRAETPRSGKGPILPKGAEETILVVEDNESVRNLIQRKLLKLGYTIYAAKNGRDALSLLEGHGEKIRLVITDLVMPEMGGLELSRTIKDRYPGVEIIALTGYPIRSERQDFENAGISDLIQKPFVVQTLAEAVKKALARKSDLD